MYGDLSAGNVSIGPQKVSRTIFVRSPPSQISQSSQSFPLSHQVAAAGLTEPPKNPRHSPCSMALHRAKRRRMEFEGGEPELGVAGNPPKGSTFSSSQYLMQHGWQGTGVALDGKEGKGLKKPLAIPQKRDVKGIGKNRDRAVEWWDSIFEVRAKLSLFMLAFGAAADPLQGNRLAQRRSQSRLRAGRPAHFPRLPCQAPTCR